MLYYEICIATEDGEDWLDLLTVDEIDDAVNNWQDLESPARLVFCHIMTPEHVDYALNWRNQPHVDWDSMVDVIAPLFTN